MASHGVQSIRGGYLSLCRRKTLTRSLAVAVSGTILNLINQGDAVFGGGPVNWTKIALTFLVPYCVATYGAVSYRLREEHEARSS